MPLRILRTTFSHVCGVLPDVGKVERIEGQTARFLPSGCGTSRSTA